MKYRSEIDGLRAIAILPVIFFHAGFQSFSGGYIGVDVFFVISGYLITSIILNEKHNGTFTLTGFYERRCRRILPPLFFVMFACLPFSWFLLSPGELKEFSDSLIAVSLFSSNFLFWKESGYFATANEIKPLLHTWSLAVEEQYYLLFPIFLFITWKFCKRWTMSILITIATLSLVVAELESRTNSAGAFYLLPTRGWELLIGAFVAYYLFYRGHPNTHKIINESVCLISLGLIFCSIFLFGKNTIHPGLYTLIPTIGTAFFILFATQKTCASKILSHKLLINIGLISYSAYLWHQPLFVFTRKAYPDDLNQNNMLLLSIFSFILAYCSWKFIETPFRRKKSISRNKLLFFIIVSFLTLTSIGTIGHLTNGFINRYPETEHLLLRTQTEFSNYVWKRFSQLNNIDFNTSGKKKVLIIGDSFGQDLVNAIFESNISDNIQVSTHHVTEDCKPSIMNKNTLMCLEKYFHENSKVNKLIKTADSIWIAISWREAEAEFLQTTIQSLNNLTDAKIMIFGTKNFGTINIKDLLDMKQKQERYKIKNKLPEYHLNTNSHMENTLSKDTFINSSTIFCNEKTQCKIFTDNNELISYDGKHLTKEGAKFYGEKLKHHPLINKFLYK